MASEAQVRSSLNIRKGNLQYASLKSAFVADVTGQKGPTPGAITASTVGTDVDLSELTTPGLCEIYNIDETYYVEYGAYDPASTEFYPIGEALPGESYAIRLSRFLGLEFGGGAGTGTTGAGKKLRIKGIGGPCNVIVNAFER